MNSANSQRSNPHRLLLNLSNNTNLKRSDKYDALSSLTIYYILHLLYLEKSYNNNEFKISSPTKNEELPYRLYSVSDIQDYFEYIIKKHKISTDNPPVRIFINKTDNRITIKLKT